MLGLQIEVGPSVGAYRICTTYKKTPDLEEVRGSRPQARRVRMAISLALFGTAVTVDTSRICSSRGHHE